MAVPAVVDALRAGPVAAGAVPAAAAPHFYRSLEWKLMSCSHCQELGQLADLASDWLFTLVQPIRSQLAC